MPSAMVASVRSMVQESSVIRYPQEFVVRVKEEYSGDDKVLNALETGDYVLGKYLMERMDLDMGPEQIILALEGGRTEDVLAEAKAAVRRTAMYLEWTRIIVDHVQSMESKRAAPVL
jgi:hypothetical protein